MSHGSAWQAAESISRSGGEDRVDEERNEGTPSTHPGLKGQSVGLKEEMEEDTRRREKQEIKTRISSTTYCPPNTSRNAAP